MMATFLRERERIELVLTNRKSTLEQRADACAILLQHPLDANLRLDIRRMFLDLTDRIAAGEDDFNNDFSELAA